MPLFLILFEKENKTDITYYYKKKKEKNKKDSKFNMGLFLRRRPQNKAEQSKNGSKLF